MFESLLETQGFFFYYFCTLMNGIICYMSVGFVSWSRQRTLTFLSYLMLASLVGLYSVPYFSRLRPAVRETTTTKVSELDCLKI